MKKAFFFCVGESCRGCLTYGKVDEKKNIFLYGGIILGIKRTYGKVNEKKTFFVWGKNFVGGNVGPTDKLIKKKHFFVGESCWGLRQNMGKKFCVWRNLVGDNVGPTEKLIKKKHFFL